MCKDAVDESVYLANHELPILRLVTAGGVDTTPCLNEPQPAAIALLVLA